MCKCRPLVKTPFCGRPGCEWPEQKMTPRTVAEKIKDTCTPVGMPKRFQDLLVQQIEQALIEERDRALEEAALLADKIYEEWKGSFPNTMTPDYSKSIRSLKSTEKKT